MGRVFLALREIRRARARFGLLIAAVALLMFLILTQQALQSGLITAFVGAIERQSAPVLVYSVDGQRTLQGSVITPPLERRIAAVPGVADTGRIGQGTFTASVNGGGLSDAALIGYAKADLGGPDAVSAGRLPRAAGEAVGSAEDFSLGDRVRIVGSEGGPLLEVVGLAEDAEIQVTPTLFVAWRDYVAATRAVNPDASVVLPSVIGVRPAAAVGPEELAGRINRASPEADALTREQAARETPGVAEVRSSFNVIFLLFALVVPLVSGLFFLIITLQKARALTLLRAIGAPAKVLVRALLIQVLIVIGGGVAVGTLLFVPLSQATVGSLSLRFDPAVVLVWSGLLLGLGLLSAIAAARRVLAIDPLEATTGGGAR
jgi:putative ABC transport system permease protein